MADPDDGDLAPDVGVHQPITDWPPSTCMTVPLMAAERGAARNAQAQATSSGRGWRPIGMMSRAIWSERSRVSPGWVSMSRIVSAKPGLMSFTVIPYGPRDRASDLVNVRRPPLAVECGSRVGPPLRSRMPGANAFARYHDAVSCWLR